MAHNFSHDFLRRLEFPHYPFMHARIALYPLVRRVRAFLRNVSKKSTPARALPEVSITERFETTKDGYQKEHWAWIEQVFPEAFWSSFVKYWPSRIFFDPPRMVTKSYDVGFKWNRGDKVPQNIEQFPEVKSVLEYLQSPAWCVRLQKYAGTPNTLSCNSFLLNTTYPGSCIIPHKDDPLPGDVTPFINMIFFIEGSGGGDSGELMLSHDADQKNIFFTPPTMKNACLVYDTGGDFYHGFPPVAPGKMRWVLTASFSPDYPVV